MNSRLTINLGLRYDKLGFLEEMNKRESSIDFRNGKLLIPDNSQNLIQPAFQPYQTMFETASASRPSGYACQAQQPGLRAPGRRRVSSHSDPGHSRGLWYIQR